MQAYLERVVNGNGHGIFGEVWSVVEWLQTSNDCFLLHRADALAQDYLEHYAFPHM